MAAIDADAFATLGVDLYHEGRLADGLELLAQRLDYAGAGGLVAYLLAVDWVEEEPRAAKGNPQPQPKPPPPPPPPPPKGER